MDLAALHQNAVQVADHVLREDLVHLGIAQRRLQPAGDAREMLGALLAAFALDGVQRVLQGVDGEAQRVREVGVQQQELEDLLRRQVGGVDLAVGLEGRARAQQPHPLQILVALGDAVGVAPEIVVVDLQQRDVAVARSM